MYEIYTTLSHNMCVVAAIYNKTLDIYALLLWLARSYNK